ncbi:hypothetical protein M8J77_025783 [Diaphorina citri]|nr:hypothetical protein M8J77_025783 [Diaphorina citri]
MWSYGLYGAAGALHSLQMKNSQTNITPKLLSNGGLPSVRRQATSLLKSTSPSLSEAGKSQQLAITQMVTHPNTNHTVA